jgi:hypothetical protein
MFDETIKMKKLPEKLYAQMVMIESNHMHSFSKVGS